MDNEPEADAISLAMFVDSLRACSDPTKRRAADVIERLRANEVAPRQLLERIADRAYKAKLYRYKDHMHNDNLDFAAEQVREFLKNPNPAGVGIAVAVTDGKQHAHEPGSRDFTAHTARNVDSCAGKTADRESGASHPAGEGCVHETETSPGVCTCGMGPISGCWKCD